jgi:hypothetical protein
MSHKKDEENLTNRRGRWAKAESAPYFWNAPTVQSRIGSIFLHLFYPPAFATLG